MPTDADAAGGGHYLVFGLVIRSALPLPGLVSVPPAPADVEVEIGPVAAVPGAPPGYHPDGDGTLLTVPDVGRYRIEGGRRITVDPLPHASERNVRVFLLGSALGAILHQRGLLPLHANAVEIAGRAVAFMGHSGAGKSTMAAWFLDRGGAVLTDDVCVVEQRGGAPVAHRGLLRLRLWREALERSGRDAAEAARSFDDQDKFDVVMPDERLGPATLPLGAAVLLRRADDDVFAVRRLRGAEAVRALMENVYRGGYADRSGGAGPLLAACAAVAARVPVLEIARGWGFERFDAEAEKVARAVEAAMADAKS